MVAAEPVRRATLLKKLHSLSGVVPLGAFVVLHLWITSSIAGSRDIYDRQISVVHGGPLQVLEVVLVFVPLAYHAAYGLWLTLSRKGSSSAPPDADDADDHGYATDLMRSLQRVSGIVVLLFIAFHVWDTRLQTFTKGIPVDAYSTRLVERLSSTQGGIPWFAIAYVIGVAATAFHLGNGLTSFVKTWGYVRTALAEARARLFFRVVGIVVFVISTALVLQLATGARFFPASDPTPPVCGSAVPQPPAPSAVPASP
jgi:succinate dehydrogenase / fumarate reductase, cytochrome b subunit